MISGGSRKQPILITGAPRSGTTWVGQMLSLSPQVGYINEPFNPTHQPGICSCVFPRWYMYVHSGNEPEYEPGLAAMLSFRYNVIAQLRQRPSGSNVEALARDGWNFMRARLRGARPLMKDPIAVFSSDWLARTFDPAVVVLVRHPAAFAASVKRLGWALPFRDLLAQRILLREHLAEFEDELHHEAEGRTDPVSQAALMWRLVYTVLVRFSHTHPDWLFLRQEDLAQNPVERFADLFGRLELRYTDRIRDEINWYSSGKLEDEPGAAEDDIRRHSRDTIRRWRERLTPEEQTMVRARCEALAARFYSGEEW
jgi:hypothetical protein